MSKIPLHELEKAKKQQKAWDIFLTVLSVITIGIVAVLAGWGLSWLMSFLLPIPWLFWGVIVASVLGGSWALGLYFWEKNFQIVQEANAYGTIDE